ncbi:tetratricopeptide repeat-containing sensor histidine kinase [Sphingobacterium sp. LRF_L2]|uniref:tetratricopeptide repeat-containing sensor histidine kinase n=1 Tax=Sphingobacterium sp. LRF_L2 TaxID=3369421 RepID=UPI003F631221
MKIIRSLYTITGIAVYPIYYLTTVIIVCLSIFFGCSEKSNPVDHPKLVNAWINEIDSKYIDIGVHRAISEFDSLMNTLPTRGVGDQVEYYTFMRTLYQRDSLLALQAEAYTDSILSLLSVPTNKANYPQKYAMICLLKGDDLKAKGRYDKAYRMYYEGKQVLQTLNDACEYSRYTDRIGKIYFEEHNYPKAISYWKEAYKEVKNCQDSTNFELMFIKRQGYLNDIGFCYQQLENLDSAAFYYNLALKEIDKQESIFPKKAEFVAYTKLNVLGNLAVILAAQGHYTSSEKIFRACTRYSDRVEFSLLSSLFARLQLSDLYIQSRQLEKASAELDSINNFRYQMKDPDLDVLWYEAQGKCLIFHKKYREAAEMLTASINLRKKMTKEKITNEMSNIGEIFGQLEQEHQKKIADERMVWIHRVIFLIILLAIFLGCLIYMIWSNYTSEKKRTSNLQALNNELHRKNSELASTLKALEYALSENKHVLHLVSHDLRNPIGAIHTGVQVLKRINSHSAHGEKILDMLQTATRSALHLISQILLTPTERVIPKREAVDFAKMVENCIAILQHKAKEKNQQILRSIPEATIKVDHEQICRVITNLLANSIKFSAHNTIISIEGKILDRCILLTCRDEGVGIPVDIQKEIFKPFGNSKREGTSGEPSIGLGLSICKQIVEAHQGKIWFESKENKGTTFYLEIPF